MTAVAGSSTAAVPAAGTVPARDADTDADTDAGTGVARRRALLPQALAGLVAALVVGGFLLGTYLANVHNGLIAVSFAAVGAFVLRSRPGHREGWLFLAAGVVHAVMFVARQYGLHAGDHPAADLPAVEWVTWLGVWPLALVLVLMAVTLMSFPDGRLPSPRWRPVVAVMLVAGTLVSLSSALWPVEYADNALPVAHPLDLGGYAAAQSVWDVAGPLDYLLVQVAWVVAVALRLRRARGDEARQAQWFAYAVCMGAVAMAVGLALFRSPALGLLAAPMIAVAAGVAIVKYRLYDIDLVVNKTLVVGGMAVLVTAGYVAVVVGVGGAVGASTRPGTALSLVATALVAVAFEPARRRVQAGADRLVYGARPTPYEALARLSTQLGAGGAQDELFTGLASAVADGVGAAEVTLWVGPEDALVAVASWPPSPDHELAVEPRSRASLGAGGRTHVRPIVHRGTLRGAVTLTKAPGEMLTAAEDRLLRDLVAQAGLVVDNVGLGAELQHRLHEIAAQAAELRAAATRTVAAQYEARRRIERDLHDGAQQSLVLLALTLRVVAERASAHGDAELTAAVGEARDQLAQALAELREMARGIHPAILTQEGLAAAVGVLAERSPVPVRNDVDLDGRLPEQVEATAYFVISEALTNAAKHAAASQARVGARLAADGRLAVTVTDDGRGGADGHWGSGLRGLADRVAAVGGRLRVSSPPGGGTDVRAELPLP